MTRGQTAFSALHVSPFKPYMHNSLQSTNLCARIMDREAFGVKAPGQHTGCAASTCSVSHSVFTNRGQCLSLLWLAKKQHTLSAGQASESTAHYENIISSEQIMEVLYRVSHQCHRPNHVHSVHVFVRVSHRPWLSGPVTFIKR